MVCKKKDGTMAVLFHGIESSLHLKSSVKVLSWANASFGKASLRENCNSRGTIWPKKIKFAHGKKVIGKLNHTASS